MSNPGKLHNATLWFLKALELEITRIVGDEHICTCPFCGKPGHLYVNGRKGVYDCKACGQHGHCTNLYGALAENLVDDFEGEPRSHLAADRNLPPEAFDGYGFGWTGKLFTLPVRDGAGIIVNVLRYRPGDKLLSAPGSKVALFGAMSLADATREAEPVYITEGAWDAIALDFLCRKAGRSAVVVAVPGANVFKNEWAGWFSGRDVRLCYDNDDAGAQGEARAAAELDGVAKSVQFFKWEANERIGMDLRDLIGGAL